MVDIWVDGQVVRTVSGASDMLQVHAAFSADGERIYVHGTIEDTVMCYDRCSRTGPFSSLSWSPAPGSRWAWDTPVAAFGTPDRRVLWFPFVPRETPPGPGRHRHLPGERGPDELGLVPELRAATENAARELVRGGFHTRAEVVERTAVTFGPPDRQVSLEQAGVIVDRLWAERLAEQASWPAVTDAERVLAVFDRLTVNGITARANFTCCVRRDPR